MEISLEIIKDLHKNGINDKLINSYLFQYRNMQDEIPRNELCSEMIYRNTVYIPNLDYIKKFCSQSTINEMVKYIVNGQFILSNTMLFPLLSCRDDFLGVLLNNRFLEAKYVYPVNSFTFNKSRLNNISKKDIDLIVSMDSIFICEGVYDQYSVSSCGYPTMMLGGSSITKENKQILDGIKYKYIISDMDSAGLKVHKEADKLKGEVIKVFLPTKDIDEFLRLSDNRNLFTNRMNDIISNRLKPKEISFRTNIIQ